MTAELVVHTHWKAEPGRALCAIILGFEAAPAWPGEPLTQVRGEVTCQECIEWIRS